MNDQAQATDVRASFIGWWLSDDRHVTSNSDGSVEPLVERPAPAEPNILL